MTIMKLLFLFIFSVVSLNVFGQNNPFNNLDILEIESYQGVSIKYDPETTEIINKALKDLDTNDPFYYNSIGDFSTYDIKAIKTKIDKKTNDEYIVIFSAGPSGDPSFEFYNSKEKGKPNFVINGLNLYIPGNGFIYISGHTNNMFDTRKKFQIVNNVFSEVEQPFYYVGISTKTLKPLTLYSDKQLKSIVAQLPKNYDIEVLIFEKENSIFLIRTEFGLVGWVKVGIGSQQPDIIDKLFFNGD